MNKLQNLLNNINVDSGLLDKRSVLKIVTSVDFSNKNVLLICFSNSPILSVAILLQKYKYFVILNRNDIIDNYFIETTNHVSMNYDLIQGSCDKCFKKNMFDLVIIEPTIDKNINHLDQAIELFNYSNNVVFYYSSNIAENPKINNYKSLFIPTVLDTVEISVKSSKKCSNPEKFLRKFQIISLKKK